REVQFRVLHSTDVDRARLELRPLLVELELELRDVGFEGGNRRTDGRQRAALHIHHESRGLRVAAELEEAGVPQIDVRLSGQRQMHIEVAEEEVLEERLRRLLVRSPSLGLDRMLEESAQHHEATSHERHLVWIELPPVGMD